MFIRTEKGEKLLWYLQEKDAQKIAKELVDRKLTEEELQNVQRGLNVSFEECWFSILDEAVRIAVEETEFQKTG